MHARVRSPNKSFIIHQIIIEPDFPCLADEIAESRPEINFKVAAFTISEKSINTCKCSRYNVHCSLKEALLFWAIIFEK